jgi:hypothetical protein
MKEIQSGKGFVIHFDSLEEMESYKLAKMKNRSDMEKFKEVISLMRFSRMLKNAPKVHKK